MLDVVRSVACASAYSRICVVLGKNILKGLITHTVEINIYRSNIFVQRGAPKTVGLDFSMFQISCEDHFTPVVALGLVNGKANGKTGNCNGK